MSRSNLTAANRGEATAAVVRMVGMLDIAFPSGTVYANSGDHALTYNGNSYLASAVMVDAVGGIGETTDLKARRVSIRLNGCDSSLITKLMDDSYHFAEVNVYLGFLDDEGQLVGDPYSVGDSLFMSSATISLDAGSGAVEISAETPEVLDARSSEALATPQSQKLRYAGDTGMDDVRKIMETEIEWAGFREIGGAGPGDLHQDKRDID